MLSPPKIKRSLPEIVTLQSVKFCKDSSLKENIPPPKMESHSKSNGHLLDKQCQATPKKHASNEEPVTPNANFKLLTSLAAAQEYANCSVLKEEKDKSSSKDGLVLFDNRTCDDSDIPFNPPSRKEKSLSLICTRFLDMYPMYPDVKEPIVVSLDEACIRLAIERRRLYDIVNVFESISMLGKQAKNQYLWYGKNYLMKALHKIKDGAIKECMLAKLQYVLEFEDSCPETKPSCILTEVRDFNQTFEHRKASSKTPKELRLSSPIPEMRKEKSLALMSQKFLMLFLVSPSKIISLSVAAKVLNGFQSSDKVAQVKTQIRRLYDIANVLSSIGLIQKEVTISQNGRKPAFKYIGPDLDVDPATPTKEIIKHKPSSEPPKMKPKSLVRHSSFQEICAVAEIERNKIYELPNSAPPTPAKASFPNLVIDLKTEDFKPKESFSIGEAEDSKLKDSLPAVKTEDSKPKESSPICSLLKDLKTLPLLQKTKSVNLDTGTKKPQVPLRSVSLPQSSFKVVNLSKQMLSANGPYYIVNPATKEVKKSPTPMGTVLLISPLSIKSTTKVVPENSIRKEIVSDSSTKKEVVVESSTKKEILLDKSPRKEVVTEKKAFNTRTLQLTAEQRDTILKSLNLSLSDGQIAAIQIEGSSKSADTDIKPRCNLLKIIEKHELSTSNNNDTHVPPQQVVTFDTEKNKDLCSTINTNLEKNAHTILQPSNGNANHVLSKLAIDFDTKTSSYQDTSSNVSSMNNKFLKLIETGKRSNSNHVPLKQAIKFDTENNESSNCTSRNGKLLKIIEKLELSALNSNGINYLPPKKAMKLDIESSELSTMNTSPYSYSSQLNSLLLPHKDVASNLHLKSVNMSPKANNRNLENIKVDNGKNIQNRNNSFKPILLEENKELDDESSENLLNRNKNKGTLVKNLDQSEKTEPLTNLTYFQNFQFGGIQPVIQKTRIQYLIKGGKRKMEEMQSNTKSLPLKEIINLSSTINSCSSDSLNQEVSEILNEKLNNDKAYESEVTIVSPIKKHKSSGSFKPLTPTYFTTPPYTPTHDTYFEFNNLPMKQINGKAYSFSLSQEAAYKLEK